MRDFLRRRLLAVIVVVLVLLLLSANRIATLLTDWWWYGSVDARDVFAGVIGARLLLGVLATLGLGVLIAVNLQVARRLRPLVVPSTPQQAIIETYRAKADPYLKWLILAVALVFGISSGVAAATQWRPFLLWQNGGAFGTMDPTFSKDVGFYVFDLPFLQFVQGWLFTSLVLVLLLTAGAHLLLGGIRPDAPRDKVIPSVKVHLSVLLALVLAARGWGYWLDRYQLNFSARGTVTGAAYTDVNAELPALYLLLAVTAVAVILTLINLRRRGFLLPGAAIGLLVLASILLQGVYPAAMQRLQVDPQELPREREYIGYNQEATRAAYGIADVGLPPVHGHQRPRPRADRREPPDHRQHPTVGPGGPADDLRAAAGAADLLRLRRRRRGPLHDRRPGPPGHAVRPRAGPDRAAAGRADLAEPRPDLHARARGRRQPGQHRRHPWPAPLPRRWHPQRRGGRSWSPRTRTSTTARPGPRPTRSSTPTRPSSTTRTPTPPSSGPPATTVRGACCWATGCPAWRSRCASATRTSCCLDCRTTTRGC